MYHVTDVVLYETVFQSRRTVLKETKSPWPQHDTKTSFWIKMCETLPYPLTYKYTSTHSFTSTNIAQMIDDFPKGNKTFTFISCISLSSLQKRFLETLDLTHCIRQSHIILVILKLIGTYTFLFNVFRTLLTAGYEYRTIHHSFGDCMSEWMNLVQSLSTFFILKSSRCRYLAMSTKGNALHTALTGLMCICM